MIHIGVFCGAIFILVVVGLVCLAEKELGIMFSCWGGALALFCVLVLTGIANESHVVREELLPIITETVEHGAKQSVVQYVDMSKQQDSSTTTMTKYKFDGLVDAKEARVKQYYTQNWLYYIPVQAKVTIDTPESATKAE